MHNEIIHWPVQFRTKKEALTPRKLFNRHYVYVILTGTNIIADKESQLKWFLLNLDECFYINDSGDGPTLFLFYQGAENDLDRFLNWLRALETQHTGLPPTNLLYVIKTHINNVVPRGKEDYSTRFILPGEIDHVLFMYDDPDVPASIY